MDTKKRLVVIGNGMAGARVVEEILRRNRTLFDITMFGAEPYGNYNRILLSNVLNGMQKPEEIFMNPLPWYRENGITLHSGVKAVRIDRQKRFIVAMPIPKEASPYERGSTPLPDASQINTSYDRVIIATGSRPFIPPIQGYGLPGTFAFRTIDDCAAIESYAKKCHKAVVIGGGLLGLEAARGLLTHGVQVTVVEALPQLMRVQLGVEGGLFLFSTINGIWI